MNKSNEMVEAIEDFIIRKMKHSITSPEEIRALAELVKALNQTPRTLRAFKSKESVAVSSSATND